MNKWKINSLQLASFIVFIIITPLSGIGIENIIKIAKVDSYISIIIMGIFGIIPLLMINYISNYNHNMNIKEIIIDIFGKTIGTIIIYLICLIFLVVAACTAFSINNLIISQFLSETPLLLISTLLAITIIYNINKGFQNMSRLSLTFLFINIFHFFIGILGVSFSFDMSNIKPILEHGLKNPFLGSLSLVTTNILPLFLILIIPKNNLIDKKKYPKFNIIAYTIGIIFCFFILFLTIGNLGYYLADIFQYPEYFVLKRISLLNFIDRIENVVTIQWIFGSFVYLSLIIYFISKSICNSKGDKTNLFITIIVSIIILLATHFGFTKNTYFNNFCYYIYPYIVGSLFIFYVIIFIGCFIKKKKKY